VLSLQSFESLAPSGGFALLAIVQPPFVFLGLCSASYLHYISPLEPGYSCLFKGGLLLMFAMAVSAVETFYTPLLVTIPMPSSHHSYISLNKLGSISTAQALPISIANILYLEERGEVPCCLWLDLLYEQR
jgi:hypothetical protein